MAIAARIFVAIDALSSATKKAYYMRSGISVSISKLVPAVIQTCYLVSD